MKKLSDGSTPDVMTLQAMQARVGALMEQYKTTAPPGSPAPPGASATLPGLSAPGPGPLPTAAPALPTLTTPAPLPGLTTPAPALPGLAPPLPSLPPPGLSVGLDMQVGQNGQDPMLQSQKAELQKAENAAKGAAAETGCFIGTIARLNAASGLAVIECQEAAQKFSGDIQIQRNKFENMEVSDTVVFQVLMTDKGPQASFAKRLGELTMQRRRILALEAPYPSDGAVQSVQEYLGFITSFQSASGYGFISCATTRQMYGSEVYIHYDQYTDTNVGDAVHFRVALNPKGVPVARSVRKAVPGLDSVPSGPPGAALPALGAPPGMSPPSLSSEMHTLIAGAAPPGNQGSSGAVRTEVPNGRVKERSRSRSASMSISGDESGDKRSRSRQRR